jgi:hypothetical protein
VARPSKLSPAQWDEVDRRLAAGEGVRALATEYGVSPATISKRGVAKQSKQVQVVAKQVAEAQDALEALPLSQQYHAMSLAEKLRSISHSMASAAELGAKTSHRLHHMANTQLQKVDDEQPLDTGESVVALKNVALLANEAAHIPVNLLAANKDTVKKANEPTAEDPEGGGTPTSGVLVVPGLMDSSSAWSDAARGGKK